MKGTASNEEMITMAKAPASEMGAEWIVVTDPKARLSAGAIPQKSLTGKTASAAPVLVSGSRWSRPISGQVFLIPLVNRTPG